MYGRREHGSRSGGGAAPLARSDAIAKIGDIAAAAGLHRIHVLAWRDVADVEAGGSELHAAAVARLWAEAGIEVTMRTSYAQGAPPESRRGGYRVIRKAGRYLVFPRGAVAELTGRHGRRDGLVEIWNGVPWLTPLWAARPEGDVAAPRPRADVGHGAAAPTWPALGEAIERRVAPPIYRRQAIVTLSESSRQELVDQLGLGSDRGSRSCPPASTPASPPGPPARPARSSSPSAG